MSGRIGEKLLDEALFGGESEEAFLNRIRARMRRSGLPLEHPGSAVQPRGYEERTSYEQKAELFVKTLQGLGGEAVRAQSREQAFTVIRDALVRRGVKGVLTSGGEWSECRRILNEAGIAVESWEDVAFGHGQADRELTRADRWGAGILWADYAVADLGSVAVVSSEHQGRSVSLVPPLMIALVDSEVLVASRRTVLERVSALAKERGVPSSLTFITGPSRSADIENDLSIGVHGPGEVIAVLVEGP